MLASPCAEEGQALTDVSKYNSDHNLVFGVSGTCMNGSSRATCHPALSLALVPLVVIRVRA